MRRSEAQAILPERTGAPIPMREAVRVSAVRAVPGTGAAAGESGARPVPAGAGVRPAPSAVAAAPAGGGEARGQLVALIRERLTSLQALLGRDATALDLVADPDDHGLLGQVADRLLTHLGHPDTGMRRLIGEQIIAGLAPNVTDPGFFETGLGVLLAQVGAGLGQAGVLSWPEAAQRLGVDTRTVAGMVADGRLHTLGDGVAAASVHALAATGARAPADSADAPPAVAAETSAERRPRRESRRGAGNAYPIFGEYGRLADTGELVQCHACGAWFSTLPSHLRVHGVTSDAYRECYGLPPGTPLAARTVRERLSPKRRIAPAGDLVSPVFRARLEACAAFRDSHHGRLPRRGSHADPAERALGEWLRRVAVLIERRPPDKAYLDEGRVALLDERLPEWRSLSPAPVPGTVFEERVNGLRDFLREQGRLPAPTCHLYSTSSPPKRKFMR
ncbi:MucR family transcriptional regulator [Leucobacter massiliensis]|uniref:Uncharacterized protein n=1 Tax=Leucobacter massiliensis TaxID=1686285 RepID=A0A2S9QPI6_9MICO|nr:MucR family transcriptional regulator [Leucobacter massiliensis]PRI11495.1 hypothetical protein B4915_06605 [Leucobacter massiliensis]